MRRSWLVSLLAAVTVAACDGAPAAPSASPPPVASPPLLLQQRTITGSVWLLSPNAPQPLSGVAISIWLETPGRAGPSRAVSSDAAGRFSFAVPSDALVRLYARPRGLFQPCLTTLRVDQTEASLWLVAEAHLAQAYDLPELAIERRLAGTIFEASPTGRVPVADAWVQVDGVGGDGRPLADTRSDGNGRYVLCGLETGTSLHAIVVVKAGYRLTYAALPAQGEGPLDVELPVCPAGSGTAPGGWCQ